MYYYIKTGSITNAQRSKNVLAKYNIKAELKRLADIKDGDGCGWTITVSEDSLKTAVNTLRQNEINVLGVEKV